MRRPLALLAAAVVWASSPGVARAHDLNRAPTNYLSRLTGVVPAVKGVSATIIEAGNRLEVRNRGRKEVVVLGYDKEPFLRISPSGTYENAYSPSVSRSATREGFGAPPDRADPLAEPVWDPVSTRTSARWYDHRIHQNNPLRPKAVADEPGRQHLIRRWTVPLLVGGDPVEIRGELLWVPAPNPLPWLLVALLLALGVGLLVRLLGWARGLLISLAVLLVVDVADVIWVTAASIVAGDTFIRLPLLMPVYATGAYALTRLARKQVEGMGWAIVTGLGIAFLGGVNSLDTLFRSQLHLQFPATLARLTAMVSLGLGVGVAAICIRLRYLPVRSA